MPEELGSRFELGRALRLGTLPLVWAASEPEETLQAYVDTWMKEEIQAEALVRNLPAFARFLPVAALFHAQVVNVSSLARDAGVARNTVEDHLSILEDTQLAFRVPSLEAELRVRERSHPKLYWVDPGVVRAVRGARGPPSAEERGPLLEGFTAMLLKAYAEYRGLFERLSCWAPRQGRLEVDFVASRGAKHVAIEVKASSRVRPEELRGLEAIADLKGVVRRLYVYTGSERLRHPSGVEALPYAEFLQLLSDGSLFEAR